MYLSVVLLTFVSFVTSILFGKFLKFKYIKFIVIFNISLTLILSIFIFYEISICQLVCRIQLWQGISSCLFIITWGFYFDSITSIMLVIVSLISFLVHIYSFSYMEKDPHLIRFISYLSLFTFFMNILITSDNLLQLFFGWEGVGLASYLLINYWFKRIEANKAALKAMFVNRIGDVGLILSVLCIYTFFKSLDFLVLFPLMFYVSEVKLIWLNMFEIKLINLICFLLFVGVIGKSAQLGLHMWLPDAMEGPTPVSALIHAATMVTAGVFILIRCSPLFEYSSTVLFYISLIGALTALFGALVASFQNDLKKIIAYSTCSQLGYMVCACGFSNYNIALFHLGNHAIFKALLFLTAGYIIHALSDEQNITKMGYLCVLYPFCYVMLFIGSMSLIGLPYLTGFFSKHYILELSFVSFALNGWFVGFLLYFSAFFTCVYSFNLLFKVCFVKNNSYKSNFLHFDYLTFYMVFVIFILSLASIFFGYIWNDLFLGFGGVFFGNCLFINNSSFILNDMEYIPLYIKILPLFLFILAFYFAKIFSTEKKVAKFLNKFSIIFNFKFFFQQSFFFNYVFNNFFVKHFLNFCYIFVRVIDKGFLEIMGSIGIQLRFRQLGRIIVNIHSGFLYDYVIFVLGALVLLCILSILNYFYILVYLLFNFIIFLTLLYIYIYLYIFLWKYIKILIKKNIKI